MFFWGFIEYLLSEIPPLNISNTIVWEKKYMQLFNQIWINKARTISQSPPKKYNPKIKMVKYLELIDQNKIWLILTLPQKCLHFLDLNLVINFNYFLTNFQISEIQKLKFRYLKFEKNALKLVDYIRIPANCLDPFQPYSTL